MGGADFKTPFRCQNIAVCYCWSFLLLISVFADHPVHCAEPAMCSTLVSWCISQLRHGTGPKSPHPVQYEAYRDCQIIVCLLIKWRGFIICLFSLCSWFCFVFMVTSYLFGTLLPRLLLLHNVFLCLWWRRAFGFRNGRKGGEDVCMGAVWVLQRVSDRERVRESEIDARRLSKKTVFLVWMPVEFRNHAINIWKDSSVFLSLSLLLSPSDSLSHSPRPSVLLSDWDFSCNKLLDQTKHKVCWVKY